MLIAIDDQCMVHEHSCILNLKYPTKIGGAHFGGKTKRLTPSRYRVWFGYVDNISRDSGRFISVSDNLLVETRPKKGIQIIGLT